MSELAVVCGAGGFIGGHLVRSLLDRGYQVRAVDIKPIDEWWQVHDCELLQLDLREQDNCYIATMDADRVWNLAADMGGMGFIETHKAECMLSVLINTHLLLGAKLNKVKRYFYASSACVYAADKQRDPYITGLREEDAYPAQAEDGYGWEKLFSERMCRHFREDYGLQTRVARFHNVYGPCFDDKTEVLTKRGWVRFDSLVKEDKIVSRTAVGVMEYADIADFQARHYVGDMYLCENSALSQCITPDHAIFATWPTTRGTSEHYVPPFARYTASESRWNRARMLFTSYGVWRGSKLPNKYSLPKCSMTDGRSLHNERSFDMSDWFAFVGWYVSEGSSWKTPTNYTVSIVQKPGAKASSIVKLLRRMGYEPYIQGNNMTISNKQLYESVQEFNHGAHNKRIPRWMLEADSDLLTTL